jgi:hypothetical protein
MNRVTAPARYENRRPVLLLDHARLTPPERFRSRRRPATEWRRASGTTGSRCVRLRRQPVRRDPRSAGGRQEGARNPLALSEKRTAIHRRPAQQSTTGRQSAKGPHDPARKAPRSAGGRQRRAGIRRRSEKWTPRCAGGRQEKRRDPPPPSEESHDPRRPVPQSSGGLQEGHRDPPAAGRKAPLPRRHRQERAPRSADDRKERPQSVGSRQKCTAIRLLIAADGTPDLH